MHVGTQSCRVVDMRRRERETTTRSHTIVNRTVFRGEYYLFPLADLFLDYLLLIWRGRSCTIAGPSSSLLMSWRARRRQHYCSVSPSNGDAGQAVAEPVGRDDEEEEGGGQRCAEEERHHVTAALLPSEPQPHVCSHQNFKRNSACAAGDVMTSCTQCHAGLSTYICAAARSSCTCGQSTNN
jgi:hypothetical protein